MKADLKESVGMMLFRKGFIVKQLSRNCFDILARKEGRILLIKVLQDANSVSGVACEDMRNLSSHLGASALIIANSASEKLEDNVVYSRFGVYTLTQKTFESCLDNQLPFVERNNAGFVANVAGEKLKQKREEDGISLTSLSRKLGVSSRMISKYESDDSEVSVRTARVLYELFDNSIFEAVDVFCSNQKLRQNPSSEISVKYSELGFDPVEARKAIFDIIAKKEKDLIVTEIGDKKHAVIEDLAQLLDASSLVIVEREKPRHAPALTKKEFMSFGSSKELMKFVREFD